MAVELKNRLETSFGVALDLSLVFRHPTLEALVPVLAQTMGVTAPGREVPAPVPLQEGDGARERAEARARVEDLSDEEVESLLLQKLESLEGGTPS
jgi:hypothetical protein